MNLNDIHEFEHSPVTTIRYVVDIGVAKQTRDVRVVFLHDFLAAAISEFEALNLLDGIGVGARPTTVLSVRVMMQRKRVLMIDRKRPAGELEPSASCHPNPFSWLSGNTKVENPPDTTPIVST